MLLIDASHLKKIEYKYGKIIFNNIYNSLIQTISKLKKINEIRNDDIITVDQIEGSQFFIFLSKRKNEKDFKITDIEDISEKIRIFLNNKMFTTLFPFIKEKLNINTGYSITFNNSSIKEERLMQAMIEDAKTMAKYQFTKTNLANKEKVYELIIDKKIKTYYQPIVNINTHKVMGYEAFSRGPINTEYEMPHNLFKISNEIGLLYELDWLCKTNIFNDAKTLEKKYRLFINIFSSSIQDSEMRVKYLEDILKNTNIEPNDVVFEISERYAIEDADFFNEITKLYSNISFAIAIDDSWIGSNIALLENLKIEFIKLNLSIIRDIDKHKISRELIKSLQKIALQVGAEIIAEGIQTKKELKALIDLGIKYGQGYFFAKPGPPFPEVNITEIYIEDAILKNSLLASVFFKRGMNYFNKGQFDQSILEFSKVLEIDENNIEAIYYRAHAYYEDKCYAVAISELNKLIGNQPAYSNAYFIKALALEKISETDKAVRAYMEYIKCAPIIYQSNINLAKKRIEELLTKKSKIMKNM